MHMPVRRALLVVALLATGLAGCKMESSTDVYLEALGVEGNANRKACALVFDDQANAHVLSSEKIGECLKATKEAQVLFEKAKELGEKGKDLDRSIQRVNERIERLESMKRTVAMMEKSMAEE